jgi:hypothetical protein
MNLLVEKMVERHPSEAPIFVLHFLRSKTTDTNSYFFTVLTMPGAMQKSRNALPACRFGMFYAELRDRSREAPQNPYGCIVLGFFFRKLTS